MAKKSILDVYYVREKNGRYIPVGYGNVKIYNGLWMVTNDGCSKRNIIARMSDLPDTIDVQKLAKCHALVELLADELSKSSKDGWYSPMEIAETIANKLYERLVEEDE